MDADQDDNWCEANDGYTTLQLAADHLEHGGKMTKLLLDHHPYDKKLSKKDQYINAVDKFGNTALHWAIFKGNYNMLNELLKRPDIITDAENYWGNTPMHYACYVGYRNKENIECLRILLEEHKDKFEVDRPCNRQQVCIQQSFIIILCYLMSFIYILLCCILYDS